MIVKEIVDKSSALEVFEKRSVSEDYLELVFFNKDMEGWNSIFIDIFGPPLKPQGINPTQEHSQLTSDYGGIQKNQILFKKDHDRGIVILMLWPWSDGEHITLKMAAINK